MKNFYFIGGGGRAIFLSVFLSIFLIALVSGAVYIGTIDPNGSVVLKQSTSTLTVTNPAIVYNGDTLAGNGLSSIVASVSLINQTTSLGSTKLFTVPANGMYRVSVYQIDSQSAIAGTLASTITWKDELGAQSQSPAPNINVALLATFGNGQSYIRSLSGSDINYSTTLSGVTGSPKYNLFISVERLA